jgi:signal transduction histidine kinase/ActR/RegA family two-component response regulator
MKNLLLLLLIATNALIVNAQVFVISNPKEESIDFKKIQPFTKVIDGGLNNFSLQEAKEKLESMDAKVIHHVNTVVSFTNHYFWESVSLLNNTDVDKTYYLEAARPMTDSIILYSFLNGVMSKQISGDAVPFSMRNFKHRKAIFKLTIPAKQQISFYINLKSDGEVLDLGLNLHTADEFILSNNNEQLFYGLFYGVLFLAGIIYLFFYFALSDKTFLFYALYVFTIGLMQFALDGMWFQYFGPSAGMLSLKGVILFAGFGTLFFGLYGKSYLKIDSTYKYLNWSYQFHAICVLILVGLIILPISIPSFSYVVINTLAIMALLNVIISIIVLKFQKIEVDWFFTVGIISLITGIAVFILNNFSLLPNSFITANGSKFGTGAEVIFLSLSMSNLIRKLRSEKEKAQTIALKKSEDMNDLKSYFMSNMSHELRTPLNAIMGIADVMIKEDISENVKANLEIIKYSSNSLLSSVNDILDFDQIERGEINLENTEFEPYQIFSLIEKNIQKQALDKGLAFKFEIANNIPKLLLGDGTRLMQIVNNVLNNSIKFTSVGNVEVNILMEEKQGDNLKLKIVVSDTGVGIPKEKIDSIYEAFTQETINDKRKFGGLGLGLSIVKKLVDLFKGDIDIKSNLEQGTVCTLILPFKVVTKQEEIIPIAANNIESVPNENTNILIVEDNTINQMLMKMILKKWANTTFAIANHGEECLEMLQQQKYDVILMDLQMPTMDGYEATIAIRAGNAGLDNTNIPIIAITADVMDGTEKKVKEVGMNKYMTKPVNQDLLFKEVCGLTKLKAS